MEIHRVASGGAWSSVFTKLGDAPSKIKTAATRFFRNLKVPLNQLMPIPPENQLPVVVITGSPAYTTSSPSSVPNMLVQPVGHIDPAKLSTFAENLQEQELGKLLFTISIPIMTGLILFHGEKSNPVVHFTLVGLSTGCTVIVNGLLLRKTYPRIACFAEQLGISIVLLSFYVQVGSYLPTDLRFVPVLCYTVSVLPFAIAVIQKEGVSSATIHNDDGIAVTQGNTEVAENTGVDLVVTKCLAPV